MAANVFFLSVWALVFSVGFVGVAAVLFQAKSRHLAAAQREAARWENRLYDRLQDMLDGFKEVRLNSARSDDLFADMVEVSRAAANIKIRAQSETFLRMVFLQSSLYALLGAVVFVIPVLSDSLAGSSITKTVTALVFVVGATFGLIQSIPIITAANTAADNIERLEAKLLAAAAAEPLRATEPPKRFAKIEVRDLMFRYIDRYSDTAFQIGPINFTLNAGDLVFITGGNGSGKSTFVRVLSGLYIPDSGTITCDGMLVTDRTRQQYREQIAAVFPDFHLFQKLYGIPDPDPAEVERLRRF